MRRMRPGPPCSSRSIVSLSRPDPRRFALTRDAVAIAFSVPIDPATIDPSHANALFVTIIDGPSTWQNPVGEPVIGSTMPDDTTGTPAAPTSPDAPAPTPTPTPIEPNDPARPPTDGTETLR